MDTLPSELSPFIKEGTVFVFSNKQCPYCDKAKALLKSHNIPYSELEVEFEPKSEWDQEFKAVLEKHSGINTVPKIYIGTKCIGGSDDLHALKKNGQLFPLLKKEGIVYTE